jgi:hypothetical protein
MLRSAPFVALALLVGVASCTAIAGLDGEYSVGDATSAGGTSGAGAAGPGSGGTSSAGGNQTGPGSGGSTTSGGGNTSSGGGNTGSGGMGGAGGADEKAMVDALDGLRVEHQCQNDGDPYCATSGVVTDSKTGAGDSNAIYEVDIHVRGIAERTTYENGTAMGMLYVGGQPDASWNTYGLVVSDPPAHYYFNGNACCNAWLVEIDIMTTIMVRGDGTLTLQGDDRNSLSTINEDQNGQPIVVSGVPPAPNAFDGQFVQLNVTAVRRQP